MKLTKVFGGTVRQLEGMISQHGISHRTSLFLEMVFWESFRSEIKKKKKAEFSIKIRILFSTLFIHKLYLNTFSK